VALEVEGSNPSGHPRKIEDLRMMNEELKRSSE
jgi:hypothetical protein